MNLRRLNSFQTKWAQLNNSWIPICQTCKKERKKKKKSFTKTKAEPWILVIGNETHNPTSI
jgi:hypothetical protein